MNPSTLLLTSKYDFAADSVALVLRERAIPYVRINREEVDHYRIAIDPGTLDMTICFDDVEVTGQNIQSLWFRQPVFLRNTPSKPLNCEEQLVRSQWSAFWRSLSVYENIKWMNWPQATYLAESKPYQLLVAQHCGFPIPKSVIGNDVKQIRRNFSSKRFIVKSLDTVLLYDGDDCLFAYTQEGKMEKISEESIRSAPLIAQEYISPKTDIRVTVVGEKIWAVKILANGYPINEDWRLETKSNLEYIDYELPREIKNKCFLLLQRLKLNFGAIDLVLQNNEYIFVEINPTGEWEWLNSDTRNIAQAVATWLVQE